MPMATGDPVVLANSEEIVDRRLAKVIAVRPHDCLDRVRSDQNDLHVAVTLVLQLERLVCLGSLVRIHERCFADHGTERSIVCEEEVHQCHNVT